MAVTPQLILQVRYELSDCSVELPILSDDEYIYFLSKNHENVRRAALDAAKTILFKLSMNASRRSVDILSIDTTKSAQSYKEALVSYIKNPEMSGVLSNILPYAGGISKSDMQKNILNPDANYVKPPVESNGNSSIGIASDYVELNPENPAIPVDPVVPLPDGVTFNDPMDVYSPLLWEVSDGSNGDPFLNDWTPEQVTFSGGNLSLSLVQDETTLAINSGEYSTLGLYQYGTYKFIAKAAKTPGTINGLFTYTGESMNTRHDEIDFEIKGDDTTKVQVNYWTNDVEHPTVLNLGFDASLAFHEYSFTWTPTSIKWFIDGIQVHEETGTRGELSSVPSAIFLNHWGTVGTMPWSTDYVPSIIPSVMQVSNVSFTAA